jgi:phenylalanyl-tRNA synthetase beta chain
MSRVGGKLLESVSIFDEYRSEELAGRSVAWRLVFRAPDRTLRDQEVDAIVARILAMLKEELDVRLRE